MLEKRLIVESETGIHARPASFIVKEATKFKSEVSITKGEKKFNAKSIMSLMTMAAQKGDEILITVNGEDEEAALNAVVNLIMTGLE